MKYLFFLLLLSSCSPHKPTLDECVEAVYNKATYKHVKDCDNEECGRGVMAAGIVCITLDNDIRNWNH